MAKNAQNLLKTVSQRLDEAAGKTYDVLNATFSGGEGLLTEGTRTPEGELVPPMGYDPSKAGIRDPFLASWDPARSRRIVNPSPEQRTIGLAEAIAEGIGAAKQTLPGQIAAVEFRMAKRAVKSLAQPFQRRYR